MSTLDEISGEIKQKTQTAVQNIQQLNRLFEYFAKMADKDEKAENMISQAVEKGNLSSFSFTGQTTDLSYFSQSDTMPLSAIRNIGDENIKEAVKQTFDKAAQNDLIVLDGYNIRITPKGIDYINQSDFINAAKNDQTSAYKNSMARLASADTAENEVQMCVGLSGNYFNDFTAFNHTDSIDLSSVINYPDKEMAKRILSNVTVKDGVATITQNGKAILTSAGFKAASVPLTEGTVKAIGGVSGAVIVATKKVAVAAVQAVQMVSTTQKR